VTVLDTSGVIDYLLADGAADQVRELLAAQSPGAAPDLLVFEVLAVLRRDVARGDLSADRACGALEDLGDLAVELFSSLLLRTRAFELRHNFTAADALFVALAELLAEPLATKDVALATAGREHTDVDIVLLGSAAGDA
jgi:predicted nucleic acid-binding protein